MTERERERERACNTHIAIWNDDAIVLPIQEKQRGIFSMKRKYHYKHDN